MTLTQITEKGIKDGEIVNADINASAAIAGTKISSNFGSQAITTTGAANAFAINVTGDNQDSLNFTGTASNHNRGIAFNSKTALSHSNDTILRINNNSEFNTVSLTGNVGIGTTSPDNTLHLLYSDSQTYNTDIRNAGLQIENDDGTDNTYAQLHLRAGNSDAYLRAIREGSNLTSLAFLTDNGGTTSDAGEAMRLSSDGRLLINTTTLSQSKTPMLEVKSDSNSSTDFASTFTSANGSSGIGVSYSIIDSFNSTNNATLTLRTNGSDALRISSSQNVGIGTTNPGSRLEIRQTTASHGVLAINRPNNDAPALMLGNNSSNNALIASNNTDLLFGRDSSGTFTERMRMRNDGGLCFNGDSAAANALDDYEEGTFTPSNAAVTLSGVVEGHYTRIGDLVTVQCIMVVPSTSNTSDIEIDGLPFNSKNPGHGSYIQGGCVTYHNQGCGNYNVLLQNNLNRLIVYKANGQRQTLDQFSNAHLRLMATYKVA